MGQIAIKDGTAQGVAKVRHYESLHEPSKRLFHDPYAQHMYPGSFVQSWLGEGGTHWLYSSLGAPGMLEMLSIRTKWLDDKVESMAKESQYLIILGAGYDTRGFRLDLAFGKDALQLWEVDQPQVQQNKLANLQFIAKHDASVAEKLKSPFVHFVSVDFNVDSLDQKLKVVEGFQENQKTLVLMEGVTQYIPKSATADTLQKLKAFSAPGSILLITYIDETVLTDTPSPDCGSPKSIRTILKMSQMTGETWMSGWSRSGFETFLQELGYQVLYDTTARDYNDKYMSPLGRQMKAEDVLSVERFVVAKIL